MSSFFLFWKVTKSPVGSPLFPLDKAHASRETTHMCLQTRQICCPDRDSEKSRRETQVSQLWLYGGGFATCFATLFFFYGECVFRVIKKNTQHKKSLIGCWHASVVGVMWLKRHQRGRRKEKKCNLWLPKRGGGGGRSLFISLKRSWIFLLLIWLLKWRTKNNLQFWFYMPFFIDKQCEVGGGRD